MEKTCTRCGETKAVNEFYGAAGTRDGLRGECKACNSAAKRQWYAENKDAVKAKVKRWQQENAERHNAAVRRRREDPAVKRRERDRHLRRKFGITVDHYDVMLALQGGVCAICRREPHPNISLHVDHDHVTGAIRSLTCFRCNQALGSFGEDAELLRAAAAYLDRHDPSAAHGRDDAAKSVGWHLVLTAWKQSA
jgi:hypothetical protein